MKNSNLTKAKRAKNDEFYTQYVDIEREIAAYLEHDPDVFRGQVVLLPCDDYASSEFVRYFTQNFDSLGLKKLISSCYVQGGKGRTCVLEAGKPVYGVLEGDGDFRSQEVTALRDEADMVITNPPFSLFREFLAWLSGKEFIIIGAKNAVTYKEVFPLIKDNKLWSGAEPWTGGMWFETVRVDDVDRVVDGVAMKNVPAVWFTNVDHGRRHEPLSLMTWDNNVKFSRRKAVKGVGYKKYDNYDAIEVPFTIAIPSDYPGVMGVPISFLDKYCPEQFEIIGLDRYVADNPNYGKRFTIEGKEKYARVLIRHRGPE